MSYQSKLRYLSLVLSFLCVTQAYAADADEAKLPRPSKFSKLPKPSKAAAKATESDSASENDTKTPLELKSGSADKSKKPAVAPAAAAAAAAPLAGAMGESPQEKAAKVKAITAAKEADQRLKIKAKTSYDPARLLVQDPLYINHSTAQILFFDRNSRNPLAKAKCETFKKEFGEKPKGPWTTIDLEGLSSRGRIILFRTISAIMYQKKDDSKWFTRKGYLFKAKGIVNFKFGATQLPFQYNPTINSQGTPNQSGNFCAVGWLNHYEKEPNPSGERELSYSFPEKDGARIEYARQLFQRAPSKNDEINKLTLILELEIARRHPDGFDIFDKLPVASLISHTLIEARVQEKDAKGQPTLEKLFGFSAEEYSFGNDNRAAVVRALLHFAGAASPTTVADIKQSYACFYGGNSEDSDSEDNAAAASPKKRVPFRY